MTFLLMLSCEKDNSKDSEKTKAVTIFASADDVWHYYCGEAQKIVGTGVEADNHIWASKTNWDIAVQRYRIKTNGGTSSSQNKGGLAVYNGNSTFNDISKLTPDLDFKLDNTVEIPINGTSTLVSKSEYQVVNFTNESMTEYDKAPIYILRGDTGSNYYKIVFTEYKMNENPGYVKFQIGRISQ